MSFGMITDKNICTFGKVPVLELFSVFLCIASIAIFCAIAVAIVFAVVVSIGPVVVTVVLDLVARVGVMAVRVFASLVLARGSIGINFSFFLFGEGGSFASDSL